MKRFVGGSLMRGVVNGCNRSGGGICGSRMMSSVAEKKEIGNGVEAKNEEKEKAVVSSYWGISRTNIKRQDGTEWPWNCFMPRDTYEADLSIDLTKHHAPKVFLDKFAYRTVKLLRISTDLYFRRRYGCHAMMLETVAAVPGMVGGMLLHLRSLRKFEQSGGWIKALLEEAENERMHLMTMVELVKPKWYERLLVLTVQGVFFNAFFAVYLLSPKLAHRVVGYLEEEAVHSYTEYLKEINSGAIENVPAPAIAIDYWRLPKDATLKDVITVIRADEAHHRDLNHFAAALDSGKTLLCGPSKDGLYPFPLLPSKDSIPPTALFGERTSIHQWHSRLGHPAFRVVAQIISKFGLPVTSNKSNFSCSACLSSKSKQLPFSLSHTQIQSPLELIYSDVWGNSPVCSRNGNRYYISFLDAYSRYTWLFPMSHKNDALPIFIKFQKYVERYFNLQIKSIQSDWGGEYRSLSNFFANCGITHRVSCPHTHQQNGAVERKHRHIVETGLALLSHANIPLRFWDDAFQTACYLINRLPQLLLKNISPFEKLFHTTPEYNFLKTFGCACWPNLRPYNSHKLQPRSTQCVFLGYSISHKGYKCFHIPTGRTYISRDVIFLETQFPFQKTQNPISSSSTSILGPPVGLLQSHSFTHGPHNRVSPQQRPPTGSSSQIQPIQPIVTQTQQLLPNPAQNPSLTIIPESPSSLPDNLSPIDPENSNTTSPEISSTTPPEISSIPANPPPPPPTHPMKTRSHHQISKPKHYTDGTIRYPIPKALLAEVTHESELPEPTCYTSASKSPHWRRAMNIEFDALLKNHTWQLVPSSPSQNIIGCKWVFKIKRHADGSIERFKARLVAKGFHQQPGIDYGETYSPVIKPTTDIQFQGKELREAPAPLGYH